MILNNYGIQNSYNIEVIPSNSALSTTWMFPDVPYLRTKPITAIMLSTSTVGVNTGLNNLGNAIMTESNPFTTSGFITLVDDQGKQFIQNMPLKELISTTEFSINNVLSSNNYSYAYNTDGIKYIQPRIIVWTKCFIYFPVATTLSNYCIQFTALYNQQ
tara:strand:+ start:230 stop:706 length:477 start_codon:yes stop_codon:yes gene_type:complete